MTPNSEVFCNVNVIIHTMNSVEEYLKAQEKKLKDDFDRIRKTQRDSAAKGSSNEQIVAEFLREHVSAKYIETNVEIID
ncbi:MAG: hypothetical protein ACREDR_04545, partial [Blastocatellia bacterium]